MAQHSNHQHQSGCTQSVSGLIPYKFDMKGNMGGFWSDEIRIFHRFCDFSDP